MRQVYPIILTPEKKGWYSVYVPDFDSNTQGKDIADAMYMAEDLIGAMGCLLEDEDKEVPTPSNIKSIKAENDNITTLVAVDFAAYRKRYLQKTVKKTLTIPGWLNEAAERANVNFSATLQNALKQKLDLSDQ
jgi:predicted RNase H-like HicB family nuclease